MDLLGVIDAFAQRTLGKAVTAVMGSADPQIIQAKALLEEGLEDLSGRGAWERLNAETTWASLAAEDQGAIESLAPGFRWMLPETLWDRTQKIPLLGAMDAQDWQTLKAIVLQGPQYSFRLRGGRFLVTPNPPADHTWAFEYVRREFILHDNGGTPEYTTQFTADEDEILLPEDIVKMDLRWRWKKEKGLAYMEDFNSAERLIVNALGRSGVRKFVKMDDRGGDGPTPGIFVPAGSWQVP